MAATMTNTVFLDVMTCGFCKKRHFGGTYKTNKNKLRGP
jgi:hypothetical protein